MDINIIYANDLSAIDVDNLLVKQIPFEQEEIVQRVYIGPFSQRKRRAQLGIFVNLDHARREEALAVTRLDHQAGNKIRVLLRTKRDLTHAADESSARVSYSGAE